MKIRYVILFVSWLVIGTSCSDFLSEYSQNQSYVESTADLDELLLGNCLIDPTSDVRASILDWNVRLCVENVHASLFLFDDDSKESPHYAGSLGYFMTQPWEQMANFWRWEREMYKDIFDVAFTDDDWALFYERIAVLNAILAEVPKMREKEPEKEADLNRVEGETRFLRAWNYFMIANIYGAPYSKNNPNDPMGIPLKLTEEVVDIYYSRNTTGEVYHAIREDLEKAKECFERENVSKKSSKLRANREACYALLSRVYLYMEENSKAVEIADKISGYSLADLNNFSETSNFASMNSSETIFSQGPYLMFNIHGTEVEQWQDKKIDFEHLRETGEIVYIITYRKEHYDCSYAVSDDLAAMFDENDSRLSVFFKRGEFTGNLLCRKYRGVRPAAPEADPVTRDTMPAYNKETAPGSYGWVRYGEVLLNKAEAQAYLGDASVVETLQKFLVTRYKVVPEIPAGGKELVDFIRKERRKELCFEGHRWFDLKRYAVHSQYPDKVSIKHEWHEIELNSEGYREAVVGGMNILEPYSEASQGMWMLPIPDEVIDFCKGNMVNAPREGVQRN